MVFAISFYLLALLLFAIDIFVPSGGVLLVCSGILAIISVFFAFRSSVNAGLIMLLVDLVTVPALVGIFFKIWPHTPIGRRVLLAPQPNLKSSEKEELKSLIGRVVLNRWPLIPTGQVQIDHRRYNAQSFDGKPIESDRRVKVIEVHERMLVVCETNEALSDVNQRSTVDGKPAANAESIGDQSTQSLLDLPADQLGLDSIEE